MSETSFGRGAGPPLVDHARALEIVSRGDTDWLTIGAEIVDMRAGSATILRLIRPVELNPNGTVSGPTLFWMCDAALFVATLATRGESALSAATASMTMNFLRADAPPAIEAECRILRSGKRLVFGDVTVFPVGQPERVMASATGIFSAKALEGDSTQ